MMLITPTRVLIVIAITLAIGLTWLWIDKQGHLRHVTWIAPAAIEPDLKAPDDLNRLIQAADPANFAAILERPLFAPDRRPPPPPAPPVPPPPPDPLATLRIRGIFSGEASGIMASVDGKMRRIKINESIGPWVLTKIEDRQVTFMQGDQSREISLIYAKLNDPQPQPQPQPKLDATSAPAIPFTAGTTVGGRNIEEDTRESLRIRNEIRAARGLPPATR